MTPKKSKSLNGCIKGRTTVLSLMALPALIYLFINNYMPMAMIWIPFKKINYGLGIWKSPWVGFQNFKFLFQTGSGWIITRNTILYNLVFLFLGLFLKVIVAILLSELPGKKLPSFYQTVIIMPFLLSWAIIGYLVYSFLSPSYGYLNEVLKSLGREPINWYIESKYWPFILTFVNMWKGVGYGSIIYLANIVGIDPSYHEAAIVDGATRFQRIRYITIPMIKNTAVTMTLLEVGSIMHADYGLFYQVPMESGALFDVTNVLDVYVNDALLVYGSIEKSSAAGMYQSVVGFILVLTANYITKKISEENALF